MHIQNIRLGFATNSSSNHSIIIKPDHNISDNDNCGEFGWGNFTLAAKESKETYFAAQLFSTISRMCNNDKFAMSIVKDIMGGKELLTSNSYGGVDQYVDHQSVISFPVVFDGYRSKDINREFLRDFKEFMLRDDVVILGGNDNDDGPHPLYNKKEAFNMPYYMLDNYCDLIAKKEGDWWIMFNQNNGSKMRLSFKDNPTEYDKSITPELIDLKITDFCDKGCEFCYQDSSPNGSHGKYDLIADVANVFSKMNLFEVAIGGGEPTEHPKFLEILKAFKINGVVPNFSTKSLEWLKDSKCREIVELCGGIAFSTTDLLDIEKLFVLIKHNNLDMSKFSIQYVMGSDNIYGFERLLVEAHRLHFKVTLLGFKDVGRGKMFKCQDYSKWLEVCLKLKEEIKLPTIGIDTTLAAESERELKEADIPNWLFSVKEGKYSMYVDAVSLKMGPSSYCDPTKMMDLPHDKNSYNDSRRINVKHIDEIKDNYKIF